MDSTDGLRGWRRGRRGALLAVAAVVGLLLASQASAAGGPLRLSDAPVGWVAGPHDPDGESAGRGLCSFQARTRAVEADRTVFEDPVGTGRLNSRWLAFARPRAARRYLRELRAALRSCTSYTGTGPNGEAIVITVAPAAFPTLGDESVAFLQQLTLHGQLRRAGYTIHARRGSRVAISSSPTTRSRTPASRCCWPGGRRAGHSAHPVASPVVWPGESPQMAASTLGDDELLAVLGRYLEILQGHPPAEEMMAEILTPDFETGFVGGHLWTGIDGLRDFLSQRSPFFDESHVIQELLGCSGGEDGADVEARTRLRFFLRSWEPPSPVSEEYTGDCFHTWRVREVAGRWRVAAQLVERFADMNDNAQRLFATPQEGLNT